MIIQLCIVLCICYTTQNHTAESDLQRQDQHTWNGFICATSKISNFTNDYLFAYFQKDTVERELGISPVLLQQYLQHAYEIASHNPTNKDTYRPSQDTYRRAVTEPLQHYPYRIAYCSSIKRTADNIKSLQQICVVQKKSAMRHGLSQLLLIQGILLPFLITKYQHRISLSAHMGTYCAYACSLALMSYSTYDLWSTPQAIAYDTEKDGVPIISEQDSYSILNRLRSFVTFGGRWILRDHRRTILEKQQYAFISWDKTGMALPRRPQTPRIMVPMIHSTELRPTPQ